jgi:hypothetical protein
MDSQSFKQLFSCCTAEKSIQYDSHAANALHRMTSDLQEGVLYEETPRIFVEILFSWGKIQIQSSIRECSTKRLP